MGHFHILRPAVYGQLGDQTVLDPNVDPQGVDNLHLILDSPPRDDLHTAFPYFFASGQLGRHIVELGLTGGTPAKLRVEMDEQYRELHPNEPLPEVFWLEITGSAQDADFGLNADGLLIVSDPALAALRRFHLDECQVYDAGNPPSQEQMTEDIWEEARQAAEELRRSMKRQ